MSKTKHTEGNLRIVRLGESWKVKEETVIANVECSTGQYSVALLAKGNTNEYLSFEAEANAARLVKCWNEYDSLVKALSDLVKWVETKEVNETPGYSFSQAKSLLKLIKQSEQ